MAIRVCDNGDGVCFLYCSTTMRPVNLESFEDWDAAKSFLTFAKARGTPPGPAAPTERAPAADPGQDDGDALVGRM